MSNLAAAPGLHLVGVTTGWKSAAVSDADYYDILGLDPSADTDRIRAAYRQVASRVHPDAGGTGALFRQVNEAYETLSDPERRATYDDGLRSGEWEDSSGSWTDNTTGYPDPDPDPGPAPGWARVDDPPTATWPPPTGAWPPPTGTWPPPPHPGPTWPGAPFDSSTYGTSADPVSRPSWFATHPSIAVTAGGALAVWVGLMILSDLAAVGILAVMIGSLGLVGSGRARAAERSRWPIISTSAGRRFASDLRFGIPMVCRFLFLSLVVLALRSEFRRATGGPRR